MLVESPFNVVGPTSLSPNRLALVLSHANPFVSAVSRDHKAILAPCQRALPALLTQCLAINTRFYTFIGECPLLFDLLFLLLATHSPDPQ